jgi:cytidine deaminase
MSQNGAPDRLSPAQRNELQRRALAVAARAYAPYSSFRVGAAVLLEDGSISTGCNVENASYRLTTCAEQSAIASAVALRGPSIRIQAVVIVNLNDTASPPCGACRQTIHEFSTSSTEIFFPAAEGALTRFSIDELLPSAFLLNNL